MMNIKFAFVIGASFVKGEQIVSPLIGDGDSEEEGMSCNLDMVNLHSV